MNIRKKYIDDFIQILVLSAFVYLAKLMKIQIPGITGIDSNLIEIPLLVSIFYLRKYWYLVILTICATLIAVSDQAYLLTFFPHAISLVILRYVYMRYNKPVENMFWHIAIWVSLIVSYYYILLLPVFAATNYLLGENSYNIWTMYVTLASYSIFELIATIIVTSLYLVQFRLRMALDKHISEVEYVVKERTDELATALEELQATNEELQATNEKLFKKNNIINQKNEELSVTLKNLKETQQQLIQAEKMASLGTLTAGVAHEINNPLNYLMGAQIGLQSYFSEHGSEDKPKTDILQNSILVGIERISNIVTGLNHFSRNNENFDENCDLHSIIDNCLVMLDNKVKYRIVVKKDYSSTIITMKGNVGKLHQVFINILVNAIDAIPENGTIEIKTQTDRSKIVVEIIDNGIGIEKKNIPYITDPFFTTKPPGKGTGLGLSISYSIIKEHHGRMDFESEVNKGTKVILTLPLRTE